MLSGHEVTVLHSLGSGLERGQSSVEWGEIPYVLLYQRTSPWLALGPLWLAVRPFWLVLDSARALSYLLIATKVEGLIIALRRIGKDRKTNQQYNEGQYE